MLAGHGECLGARRHAVLLRRLTRKETQQNRRFSS
jgi:hypothetical protein